jgi:hypothetical protein
MAGQACRLAAPARRWAGGATIMGDFWGWLVGTQTGVYVVCAIAGAAVIATLAAHWTRVRLAQIEANLKQQMLDKGMSAAEIDQVLKASREPGEYSSPQFTGEIEADKAGLVTFMAEYEYGGGDIERVIREFGNVPAGMPAEEKRQLVRARARAVQGMVENEKEAEEIERVLRAFHGGEKPEAQVVHPT